ncbi:MAG: hypothetical protein K5857_00815 [Lachnospiraceae bacterium]|nr:hypothetical protein [Lachnospiraceae bacterium]
MKLKSYLRGLGTGLFISAVLMGIATGGRVKELSDAEIKQRAAALGMVEEEALLLKPAAQEESVEGTKEEVKEEVKAPAAKVKEEKPASDNAEAVGENTEETGEEKADEEEIKEENTGEEETEETEDTEVAKIDPDDEDEDGDDIRDSKEDRAMGGQSDVRVSGLQNNSDQLGYNEYFTIQIASGSSSETVSRLLKSGGAIDDAGKFDDFLCDNHYDKKITPGVFKIPVGADYKQIAEIITGN